MKVLFPLVGDSVGGSHWSVIELYKELKKIGSGADVVSAGELLKAKKAGINSKKIVLGDGNINSSIMLVGDAPGTEEENSGKTFLGEVGNLLKKMLAPQLWQKPLFAFFDDLNHLSVFIDLKKIFSSSTDVYAA